MKTCASLMIVCLFFFGMTRTSEAVPFADSPNENSFSRKSGGVSEGPELNDGNTGKVFWMNLLIGVSVQAPIMGIALLQNGLGASYDDDAFDDDLYMELGLGAMLLNTPMIGALVGASMWSDFGLEGPSLGSMALGGYIGSAVAYGLAVWVLESDDPAADGRYDGGYFGKDPDARKAAKVLALGLAPILLPTIGVTIGYAAAKKHSRPIEGRTPWRGREKKNLPTVSFALPTPQIINTADRSKKVAFGVNLLQGTF